MSMRIVSTSQITEMKCDGCSYTEEFDAAKPSAESDFKLSQWIKLEKFSFGPDGKPIRMQTHAHTLECVVAAAASLLVVDDIEDHPIDLNSLRAN